MYNGEMVKRLERDALGTSFFHSLQSPVSELVHPSMPGPHGVSWSSMDSICRFLRSKPPCSTLSLMPSGHTSCSTILSR